MRRRPNEYRRRRRLSYWIWGLLVLFLLAGLVLFIVHHNQHEDRVENPILVQENAAEIEQGVNNGVNFTEEKLSAATSFARQLSDQTTLAKAYVIISKEHNDLHLAWELNSKIRSSQLLLSKAVMRGNPITLDEAEPIIKSLSALIYEAQDSHYDIASTIMTMKSHMQALEDRANAATIQGAIFAQLASEALPKSYHCLHMKLVTDWVEKTSFRKLANERRNSPKLVDNNLHHFCIFSDNILAVSAVVNSTVSNADHPKQLVFHVVTNGISYKAMQTWFLGNDFRGSVVEVRNVDDFSWLNATYEKYLPLLNRLRFYVPEIYPQLEKVVFLDHDVVVQKDLTFLFSLDLHGNANGAVETCLEAFHRYYKYLNFSNPMISSKVDPQACGWAFGMNVFDLLKWRKENLTARYHYWQEQNRNSTLWKLGSLPAGLLTFYGHTEPLDRRWHVLGLGHDMNVDSRLIESAAVIHFNGNMKPWLKLGIGRYKPLWERYVNQSHRYVQECATI